jgi:hypothetical protein
MSALSEAAEILFSKFISSLAREGTTLSAREIAALRSAAAAEERGFLANFSKNAAGDEAAAATRFRTTLESALPGSEAVFNSFAAAQRQELASLAGVIRGGARSRAPIRGQEQDTQTWTRTDQRNLAGPPDPARSTEASEAVLARRIKEEETAGRILHGDKYPDDYVLKAGETRGGQGESWTGLIRDSGDNIFHPLWTGGPRVMPKFWAGDKLADQVGISLVRNAEGVVAKGPNGLPQMGLRDYHYATVNGWLNPIQQHRFNAAVTKSEVAGLQVQRAENLVAGVDTAGVDVRIDAKIKSDWPDGFVSFALWIPKQFNKRMPIAVKVPAYTALGLKVGDEITRYSEKGSIFNALKRIPKSAANRVVDALDLVAGDWSARFQRPDKITKTLETQSTSPQAPGVPASQTGQQQKSVTQPQDITISPQELKAMTAKMCPAEKKFYGQDPTQLTQLDATAKAAKHTELCPGAPQ